tara:strand:+ start:12137 stop:14497 length:2361 start_codon:yes stop_codon:yes gene_type:complete
MTKMERKMKQIKTRTRWLVAISFMLIGGMIIGEVLAQNSAMVRSGAGNSSLTVQQLSQQAQSLRNRNTQQNSDIADNQAEMDSIEDDTAVQQDRIDDLDTELTANQPTGKNLDDRSADALTDAQDIEPHAKANLPSTTPSDAKCPSGQKLYWGGSSWSCTTETDPTLGIHGRVAKTPPACATDEKTIWSNSTNNWSCVPELDVTGAAGPAGPDGAAGPDGEDGGGIWQYGSGGKIYFNTGLVGIGGGAESGMALRVTGAATIDGNLDVGGNIKPGTGSCAGATEGGMRYNSGNGEVEVCVNGAWQGVSVNGSGLCVPPGSCQTPWATWVNPGGSVTAYQTATVAYGTSCNGQTRTCSSGTLSGSYNFQSCTVNPPANCSLPWGGSLAHGASVTAYASSSVACTTSCSSQTRTCNNGTLSGSYGNQSCVVNACRNCSLPWGGSIGHGGSVTAYSSSAPSCGTACSSQTRTCNDSSLSGSYTNSSCSTRCCLPWGGSIASGSSTTAYAASSVACGGSCSSQTRSCSGTTLSGSYNYSSCSVSACAGCSLPWGGSIGNGASVTAYQNSSVACGSSCNSQTRTCTNGSLSGSYANSGCSVGACGCNLPWGGSITNGQSRTAYASSSVGCGGSCSSQTRTCTNGSLSGSYNYGSCSVGSCSNCSLDGVTVNHGSSRTFYASSRSCGQACTAIDQTRSCNNGSLSGSSTYSKASCPAEVCSSCTAPDGSTVSHGSCRTRYTQPTAQMTCGLCEPCSQATWCCNNGSGSGTWGAYSSCSNSCTCNPTCSFNCY